MFFSREYSEPNQIYQFQMRHQVTSVELLWAVMMRRWTIFEILCIDIAKIMESNPVL